MRNYARALIRVLLFIFMLVPMFAIFYFVIYFTSDIYCTFTPFSVRPIPEIKKISWSHTGLITIWFDDAYNSRNFDAMMNLMNEYGFVGAISVPTRYICKPKYLTWHELIELQDKGWETTVQSDSQFCDIKKYKVSTILDDVLNAKKIMESRGLRSDTFVMPCGFNQTTLPDIFSLIRKYYKACRHDGALLNPIPITDPYNITAYTVSYMTPASDVRYWISAAKKQKKWLIIVFHQNDIDAYQYHNDIAQVANIFSMIKQSGLPVVLPSQALTAGKNYRSH